MPVIHAANLDLALRGFKTIYSSADLAATSPPARVAMTVPIGARDA